MDIEEEWMESLVERFMLHGDSFPLPNLEVLFGEEEDQARSPPPTAPAPTPSPPVLHSLKVSLDHDFLADVASKKIKHSQDIMKMKKAAKKRRWRRHQNKKMATLQEICDYFLNEMAKTFAQS